MTAETVQTVVSVAGLLLAVVGVPALFMQIRDLRQSIRSQAHAAIYAQAAEFRGHLVAHPELRGYFFSGQEIEPGHPDYDRVVTLAEIFLNYLEHIAVMGDSFGRSNRGSLERFCRAAAAGSPVLRQRMAENPDAYSGRLRALIATPVAGRAAVPRS